MTESVHPARLFARARDWSGAVNELVDLGKDIAIAFKNSAMGAAHELRQACLALLDRPTLPPLYRAQFLVFMAVSEDEDEWEEVKQKLLRAKEAIDQALQAPVKDTRAIELAGTIEVSNLLAVF